MQSVWKSFTSHRVGGVSLCQLFALTSENTGFREVDKQYNIIVLSLIGNYLRKSESRCIWFSV
jgi:hypothetical protein